MELKEVKKILEELNQDNVTFDPHFYKRVVERPISESMARSFLSQLNNTSFTHWWQGWDFALLELACLDAMCF